MVSLHPVNCSCVMGSKVLEKIKFNTARYMVETALKKMGYPYSIEEFDDGSSRVCVAYQGDYFYICMDEGKFICIQLFAGPYADVDDVEDFSRLRRAINKANRNSPVTIVYTILEEEPTILWKLIY